MNNADTPPVASVQEIDCVFIVGAGTMGCEIGFECARHGVRVLLHDSAPLALQQVAARMQKLALQFEADGHWQSDQTQAVLQRIEMRPGLDAASEADLVIECVPEIIALKERIFREVTEHCRPETVLATNTSSFVPSQLTYARERR